MNDLVTWLRHHIAVTRATAEAASAGRWEHTARYGGWAIEAEDAEDVYPVAAVRSPLDAEHVVVNEPRTVLAQCEAHTAILDLHGDQHDCIGSLDSADWPPRPCDTVRLLALAYQHRPGYREEWKP